MKKFIDLIISYKFSLIYILFYELIHILLGYKGNSFNIRNDLQSTDNIPCPYYFLHKIYDIIKKENIKSFVDLGCGNGRVLYFFNKKMKIDYLGVELFEDAFNSCLKIFKNNHNVKLIKKSFFDLDFKNTYDCYFLNDPLKEVGEHNRLVTTIISSLGQSQKPLFVTVNLTEGKSEVFASMNLLYSLKISSRSINIYKYV